MEFVATRPPKLTITNLASGVTVEAQFNPEQFEESVSANYKRQGVTGLSHEVLQFSHSTNHQTSLDLAFVANSPADLERMTAARRFFLSLAYPRRGEDVLGGAPPRVLVVWPRMLSLTCVMSTVRIAHNSFNRLGYSVRFVATVQLEEIRDFRITSEEVYEDNQFRLGQVPGLDVE